MSRHAHPDDVPHVILSLDANALTTRSSLHPPPSIMSPPVPPTLYFHKRTKIKNRALLHDSWTMISFSLAGIACPRMNAPARRPPPAANAAAAAASAAAGKTAGMSAASIVAGGARPAANGNGAANGSNGAANPPPPPPQPEPYAAEAKFFSEVGLGLVWSEGSDGRGSNQ